MVGQDGGTDDRFARAAAEGFGAFINKPDAGSPLECKTLLSRTMKVKMQIYQLGILRISRELVRGNRRLSA
jgi:hypothetical protein